MTTRPEQGLEAEHEDLQVLLGAFVLGGLGTADHQAFSRHLRHCSECQREAAQLSGLPALLDLVEPAEAAGTGADEADETGPPPTAPAEPAPAVVLLDRVRAARKRRRWRLLVAAAVLAVLAGGIGASVGPVLARVNAPPASHVVATAPSGGGNGSPRVEIDLVTRTWGTQMDLRGTSLPTGEVLFLKVTDRDGHSYDVASWTGTPTGRLTLTAACWMKPADIVTLAVHTRDGTPVATASA